MSGAGAGAGGGRDKWMIRMIGMDSWDDWDGRRSEVRERRFEVRGECSKKCDRILTT